ADRPESILFLAGDKRRDVLPDCMAEANIPMLEIQAYKTCMHPQLKDHLNSLTYTKDDWFVLFSPSGVDYIKQLGKHPMLASCKLAAIGPTTSDHLQQMGLTVHAVAEKPRASFVTDAIVAYD
ncbi:tetrapyrrole biosynthesis, uroporphyrinogen III synthase, partial [Lichtheimia hyalospora FSU 10163]